MRPLAAILAISLTCAFAPRATADPMPIVPILAERPAEVAPADHDAGHAFVYLGKCSPSGWDAAKFADLMPCDRALPSEGIDIRASEGMRLRVSLPTEPGHYGEVIGTVRAGRVLRLLRIHQASRYTDGPQVYWGEVERPTRAHATDGFHGRSGFGPSPFGALPTYELLGCGHRPRLLC